MNFSISGGIGLIGGLVLLGALVITFTLLVTIVIRAVRGRDEGPATLGERPPEDDYIL